jgi:hypothetical protein
MSTWRLSGYSKNGGETYERVVPDDRFPVPEVQAALLRAERAQGGQASIVVSFPSPRRITVPRDIQADRRRFLVAVGDGMGNRFRGKFEDDGPAGYSDLVSLGPDRIAAVYEGSIDTDSFGDPRAYIAGVLWRTIDLATFDDCDQSSGCFDLARPLPAQLYDGSAK